MQFHDFYQIMQLCKRGEEVLFLALAALVILGGFALLNSDFGFTGAAVGTGTTFGEDSELGAEPEAGDEDVDASKEPAESAEESEDDPEEEDSGSGEGVGASAVGFDEGDGSGEGAGGGIGATGLIDVNNVDGIAVYALQGNVVGYRLYDNSSTNVSAQNNISQDFGETIQNLMIAGNHERDEFILLTLGDEDQVCSSMIYDAEAGTWGNYYNLTDSCSNTGNAHFFDVAFEDVSGDAIIVYASSGSSVTTLNYTIWDGSSYSASQEISYSTAGRLRQARLYPKEGTDEMMFIGQTGNQDVFAWFWNGSSFEDSVDITSVASDASPKTFSFSWESLSGDGVLAYGQNKDGLYLTTFNSSNKSWEGIVVNATATTNEPVKVQSCADPNSDYVAFIFKDSGSDVYPRIWNGTDFETSPAPPTEETSTEGSEAGVMNVDCAWNSSGVVTFMYVDGANADDEEISYFTYDKSSWSVADLDDAPLSPTLADDGYPIKSIEIAENPVNDDLMVHFIDGGSSDDLGLGLYSEGSWIPIMDGLAGDVLECGGLEVSAQCAYFAWDQYDVSPNVTSLSFENESIRPFEQTEVNVTVVDNIGVSQVFINFTDPDGTVQQIELTDSDGDDVYNGTYTATETSGVFNVTIIANDTSTHMNVNDSELSTFTVNNSLPVVSDLELLTATGGNATNENVSASFTLSDDNNDSVRNVTTWYLNSSSIMVLNMPFEVSGDENRTNATDYSPYGNNGTPYNLASTTDAVWNATGGFDGGGAYEFDGGGGGILVGNDPSLHPTEEITVCTWVSLEGAGGLYNYNAIVSVDDDDKGYELMYYKDDDVFQFWIYDGNWGTPAKTNSTFTGGEGWQHLCGTYNNGRDELFFYLNGVQQTDGAQTGSITYQTGENTNVYIGDYNKSGAATGYFNGAIDEVMIFNRTLSVDQIQAIYDNQSQLLVSQETDIDDSWSVCVTGNDGYDDGTEVCSSAMTILEADSSEPTVTVDDPTEDSSFNVTDSVVIAANVSDTTAVETVLANVSYPNGTLEQYTLEFDSGSRYNISFSSPALLGSFNVTYIANDSLGNENSSVTTNFTLVDQAAPTVTRDSPEEDSVHNISGAVVLAANVSDSIAVDTVLVNVSYPNGTLEQYTLELDSGDRYNVTFTAPVLLGNFNVTYIANDSSGNSNSSVLGNFTITDPFAPNVTGLLPENDSSYTSGDIVEISANLSDQTFIDTVLANVSLPNGSISTLTLSNGTNHSLQFNASFTTDQVGVHNVTFIANDTSGMENDTERTNFTVTAASSSSESSGDSGGSSGGSGSGGGSVSTNNSGSAGAASSVTSSVEGDSHKEIWTLIYEGETASVQVDDPLIAVTEISFLAYDTLDGAWVEVEVVSDWEIGVSFLPTGFPVYQYLHIFRSPNFLDEDVSESLVSFRVDREWLDSSGYQEEQLSLIHYNGDTQYWFDEDASLTLVDDVYAYYEAEVEDFSYFAVAVSKEADSGREDALIGAAGSLPREEQAFVPELWIQARESLGLFWLSVLGICFLVFVAVLVFVLTLGRKRD